MKNDKIPDSDHLLRIVKWTNLWKDEDENVLGILPSAFELRVGEEFLSATWVEFCGGDGLEEGIVAAVSRVRGGEFKPSKKSGFAIGRVGDIKGECEKSSRKIRIIHDPEADNDAHAALKQWPQDDEDLFVRLAVGAWGDLRMNCDYK